MPGILNAGAFWPTDVPRPCAKPCCGNAHNPIRHAASQTPSINECSAPCLFMCQVKHPGVPVQAKTAGQESPGRNSAPPPGRSADIPVRNNVRWVEWLGTWAGTVAFRSYLRTGMSTLRRQCLDAPCSPRRRRITRGFLEPFSVWWHKRGMDEEQLVQGVRNQAPGAGPGLVVDRT